MVVSQTGYEPNTLPEVLGTHVPRHVLCDMHVWGCPCYVLDTKLQDGGHIPKFEPGSRRGVNLGWSPLHASTVPLVLNLTTGHVSPQFHVVFDDWFTTVDSSEVCIEEGIESNEWVELFNNGRFLVAFDDDDPMELDDEWLTELERLDKHKRATDIVQGRMDPRDAVPERNIDVPGALDLPPTPATVDPRSPTSPWAPAVPTQASTPQPLQREHPQQREPPTPKPPVKRMVKDLTDNLSNRDAPTLQKRKPIAPIRFVAGMIALLGNQAALSLAAQVVHRPVTYKANATKNFWECDSSQKFFGNAAKNFWECDSSRKIFGSATKNFWECN